MVPGGRARARDSPYRDFYVWVDEKPPEKPGDVVFPDQESSNWAYDRRRGQWYLHRFYSHQPDLNMANPEVRDEIAQVVGFWLEQGLSGFRVDAVPFMLEPMGMPGGALVDPHELLRDLRALPRPPQRRGDPAGRGQPAARGPARSSSATRTATSCRCCSRSRSTRRCTWRSRASRRRRSSRRWRRCRRSRRTASGRASSRNHDELTLDKLSASEREEVFAAFGPEQELQLFGRGLRRRLPTMLDGDEQRAADGLLASCSRSPARRCCSTARRSGWARTSRSRAAMSVRAPMQWSDEPNGGFSTTEDPKALCRPRGRGEVRARARQRRRPAARPRLAAELVRAPDPPAARVPGARLGRRHRARAARARRSSPTAATGTTPRSSPSTTSPATTSRRRCRSTRARARSWTCSARTTSRPPSRSR